MSPSYWTSMGVSAEQVRILAAKSHPRCPQCSGDGLYLDAGGLPVACGCTEGVEQRRRSEHLCRHTRHQGGW